MRQVFKGGNYSSAETIRGNTVYIIRLICQKYDTFLGNSVCIPFIIRRIDTEPGFPQERFSQIRPIG